MIERMCRDGAETIGRNLRKSMVLGPQRGELCLQRARLVRRDGADDEMCRDGADDAEECAVMAQKQSGEV